MMSVPKDLNIPIGYRLTPELKTERIQVRIRPSIKEAVKEEADARGISLNEYINQTLEAAVST